MNPSEAMQWMDTLRPALGRLQKGALLAGIVGLAACAVGAFIETEQFFRSYLFGCFFWLGLTTGSLALLMLHHVVGAGCLFLIRRPLEAATRVLPHMLALFAPIFFGMPVIYSWAQPETVANDEILQFKQPYLNVPFFIVRTFLCFALFIGFAYYLNKLSRRQDEDISGEEASLISHKLNLIGSGGLLVFAMLITIIAVDWLMSLDPHWFSSLFGAHFAVGQILSVLACSIVLMHVVAGKTGILERVPRKYFRDLGNLTLAFTLLWAYMAFSQWVIIYTANVAEEAGWYARRAHNGWQYVAGSLIFIQFALPFFVLLVGSNIKKRPALLARVAVLIIVMRFVDLFWNTAPNFENRQNLSMSWLDIAAPIGIGGIWLFFFAGELMKTRYLVPLHDPRFSNEMDGAPATHAHAPLASGTEVSAHG